MNSIIKQIANIILALSMVVFGLNKFFGFIPVAPPTDPLAQQFMAAMFSTYLFKIVAVTEIVGGLLLLFSRTKFIGWLVLLPVIFNIVAFHIAHDFIGNGLWLLPTLLLVIIGYFYMGRLKTLIKL